MDYIRDNKDKPYKYKKPFEEIKYDIIKLEDFPKEQHEIIELSKKYKI